MLACWPSAAMAPGGCTGREPRDWPGSVSSLTACGPARSTRRAEWPSKTGGRPMMTKPPAPDDRQAGNGHVPFGFSPGRRGDDWLATEHARLAGMWALALQRFRAQVQRGSATGRDAGSDEEEGERR